jgi:hypothetical protein
MMQKSTAFTTIFRVKKSANFTTILRVKKCHFHYDMQKKELSKSVQPFSSDALTNQQHFIFIIQGVFESCAEILITSYWLHVELGKNTLYRLMKIKLTDLHYSMIFMNYN